MIFSFPTAGVQATASTPGGGGGSSLALIELRTSDTNYTAGQAARIKPGTGGHVEVAIGNTALTSKGTIGIYNASGLAGTQAPIVTKGPTDAFAGCPDGPAYRDSTGAPVLDSSLSPGDFTCPLGVGDGTYLEVQVGEEVQV